MEVTTPLTEDGTLTLYTWNDKKGKEAFWHSSAHILAQALEELYEGIHLTIGPAIASGFFIMMWTSVSTALVTKTLKK